MEVVDLAHAATVLAIDTATWLFAAKKRAGAASSREEGAALVALLKVEGGVLLSLYLPSDPPGAAKTRRDQHLFEQRLTGERI